jgi:predicted DCC family thiol-disulfide oxidoreductase YuxK
MDEGSFPKPVLIYDGDCGFCTRSVNVLKRLPVDVEVTAFQFTDLESFGTTEDRATHEVLWVDRTGRIQGGAQAVARLLISAGGIYAAAGWTLRVPPVRWLAAGVYRLIADNRQRMPGGTAACALPPAARVTAARGGASG